MSAAIGAFGRVAPYDLFEAETLEERAKVKLAEKLSRGAKVCCCTLAWCGGVKDVVLVPLNAAGIGGLKTKGVIKTSTNKVWKVKASHYSAGNQLYLGLHHFDKDFAKLGADKRSVVLSSGADPSHATEQTAWNTAEILAELTRVNAAEALLNARELAAGALPLVQHVPPRRTRHALITGDLDWLLRFRWDGVVKGRVVCPLEGVFEVDPRVLWTPVNDFHAGIEEHEDIAITRHDGRRVLVFAPALDDLRVCLIGCLDEVEVVDLHGSNEQETRVAVDVERVNEKFGVGGIVPHTRVVHCLLFRAFRLSAGICILL